MSEHLIEAKSLRVLYGRAPALDGVSFAIPHGAIGLLGPNGSGKSTLLKTLLGFLTPDSGGCTVKGLDPRHDAVKIREHVGYMSESDSIIPGMSGVEFVAYMGQVSGMPREEALMRAHATLRYVGLGEARYRAMETYSQGMRQRAKLAQALVHDPDLLFLDEPTNGLDPKGRQEMLDLVKDITHRLGISVFLSTHLLKDVEYVCKHVVVFRKGKCLANAPVQHLKDQGEKRMLVRLRDADPEKLPAAVRGKGVDLTPVKGGFFRVTLAAGQTQRDMARALRDAGAVISGLTIEESSLEEIFMNLVLEDSAAETAHAGV